MRRTLGVALLLTGLLIIPATSLSQPPGGGKFSKFGAMNPDDIFERYAKGKDAIVLSELDQRDQQKLQFLAGMMGITISERTTREQFKEHFNKGVSMVQSGAIPLKGLGGGGTPATQTGGADAPKSDSPARIGGGPPMMDRGAMLEMAFRKMDKNNDGTLSADEIPENMQREREQYDKNRDGFIDIEEFKNYVNTVRPPREGSDSGRPQESTTATTSADRDRDRDRKPNPDELKPSIYRVGNLPKDLPEWFVRLDKAGDCDGQVGLWEARNDKAVMEEFNKYDLNSDGLITAEEVLRLKASLTKKTSGEDVAKSGDRDRDRDRDRGSRFSFGGGGPPSFGPPSTNAAPTSPGGGPPSFGGGGPPSFGGFRGFGPPGGGASGSQTSPATTIPSGGPPSGFGPPRTDGQSSGGRPPFGSFGRPSGDSGGSNATPSGSSSSGSSGNGSSGFRGFGKGSFGRGSSGGSGSSSGPPRN